MKLTVSGGGIVSKSSERIDTVAQRLLDDPSLYFGIDGSHIPVIIKRGGGNPSVQRILSKLFRKTINDTAKEIPIRLTRKQVDEIQSLLADHAEASGDHFDVKNRVTEIPKGCIIDIGDDTQNRIVLEGGKVRTSSAGCDPLFGRSPSTLPFVKTGPFKGDLELIFQYLNMAKTPAWTLIAWMLYTLSTERNSSTSYPILVIIAGQGSSKSTLCKLIIRNLVDPSSLGVQGFPTNRQDMVIASNHAFILIYDNLRYLSKQWSDILCIASTGGTDPTRRLYTDDELVTHFFKVPLVLNGIHDFIVEPDLAQRCVFIDLDSISEDTRIDEKLFTENFNQHLPKIFKGLLELLAKVFEIIDTVEVTHPQRMIRFVKYLAAIEQVAGLEKSSLQKAYSDSLQDRQRDAVLSDPLGSIIYEMVTDGARSSWSGTPTELLNEILGFFTEYDSRKRKLPDNPSMLSRRLQALAPGLLSQQVEVELTRAKERKITITNLDAY